MRNNQEIKKVLSLRNLLLMPRNITHYTKDIDVKSRLTKYITLNSPVLLSQDELTLNSRELVNIALLGGMGVISGNMSPEYQVQQVLEVKSANSDDYNNALRDVNGNLRVGARVKLQADIIERTFAMANAGLDAVFIDAPYAPFGDMLGVIRQIRQEAPAELQVIAGNVFTADGARSLIESGADAVKIGYVSNEFETLGVGSSNYSSIVTITDECYMSDTPVIFDGGSRITTDMFIKSIVAGIEAVIFEKDILQGESVDSLITKLKTAIMYTGNENIETFMKNAEFVQVN